MQNNMSAVLPTFFDVIMTSNVIDIYVQFFKSARALNLYQEIQSMSISNPLFHISDQMDG